MNNLGSRSADSFFIKTGYRHNLVQATLDQGDSVDYWNEERLATSKRFQHDVYAQAIQEMSNFSKPKILDVGSGPPTKLSSMLVENSAKVYLIDQPNTENIAKELMPEANFVAANLEEVDCVLDTQFDIVICADVIEHLVNPDPCLRFIRDHLSPSGLLYISTPERDILRGRDCMHSPHPMHVREWNQEEFQQFLMSRNFEVLNSKILPQERTSIAKNILGRTMMQLGHPPSWYSCQLAVCRAA